MDRKLIVCCIVSTIVLVYLAQQTNASSFQNFLRQNTPDGFTMDHFIEICESCGSLYGNDFTYKCLSDSSHKMFKGCMIAVMDRRR